MIGHVLTDTAQNHFFKSLFAAVANYNYIGIPVFSQSANKQARVSGLTDKS